MRTFYLPVGQRLVELLTEGDAIVRMMQHGKEWEPETRHYWPNLMTDGATMIDVGAYTGVYAIASALHGMRAYALEPHPTNFKRLTDNASLNSVRMVATKAAASDVHGEGRLYLTKPVGELNDTATLERCYCDGIVAVATVRIDGLENTGTVGLIKMDVEGHEARALQGARDTIQRYHPALLIEILDASRLIEITDMLARYGYRKTGTLDRRNHLFTRGG